MVHNNFIVGPDRKRERFRKLGLWYLTGSDSEDIQSWSEA